MRELGQTTLVTQIPKRTIHEAGHAAAHYVLGRPIEHVRLEPSPETKPVPGTALSYAQEAVIVAAGVQAEIGGAGWPHRESADYANARLNAGWGQDEEHFHAFLRADASLIRKEVEDETASLLRRYWPFVTAVAIALERARRLDQETIVQIAADYEVVFGEAAN